MKLDLDQLKADIEHYLEHSDLVMFPSYRRLFDTADAVQWNTYAYPDFKGFLECARKTGVRLITFYSQEFDDHIDEALERLADCDMPREEQRALERRLTDLRMYQGFTCEIELGFDYQGRVYCFELRTDWFMEFLDAADEIDDYFPSDEEPDEDEPLGGYFSRN